MSWSLKVVDTLVHLLKTRPKGRNAFPIARSSSSLCPFPPTLAPRDSGRISQGNRVCLSTYVRGQESRMTRGKGDLPGRREEPFEELESSRVGASVIHLGAVRCFRRESLSFARSRRSSDSSRCSSPTASLPPSTFDRPRSCLP